MSLSLIWILKIIKKLAIKVIFIAQEEELQIDLPLQSLYFYSIFDPYHKKLITMISIIEKIYKMPFYAIDANQFNNQCKRFMVESISTVLILKNGEEIKRMKNLILTNIFKSAYADIY
jgi:hypothetical protein